jgi:MtfA peptidase
MVAGSNPAEVTIIALLELVFSKAVFFNKSIYRMIFYLIIGGLLSIITILLFRFVFTFTEHLYGQFFYKPFFVHLYLDLKTLTPSQKYILQNQVPFFLLLKPKSQKHFEHRVATFLKTYAFVEKDSFKITDEVRILIASSSIILSFGMRNYLFSFIDTIIVYPSQYYSTINEAYHKGEFNPRMRAVVFSWQDFLLGLDNANDNINLGLHEFAHVLNYHGLKSDDPSANIFSKVYAQIQEEIQIEENLVKLVNSNYFRAYAFTNNFEFIAVILEHFFETPKQFETEFPELYNKVVKLINFNGKYFL